MTSIAARLLNAIAEGSRPSVSISSRDHGIANDFLLTDKWRSRHGYMGMPSTKTFTFASVEDRKEFLDYLDSKNVSYKLDQF